MWVVSFELCWYTLRCPQRSFSVCSGDCESRLRVAPQALCEGFCLGQAGVTVKGTLWSWPDRWRSLSLTWLHIEFSRIKSVLNYQKQEWSVPHPIFSKLSLNHTHHSFVPLRVAIWVWDRWAFPATQCTWWLPGDPGHLPTSQLRWMPTRYLAQ